MLLAIAYLKTEYNYVINPLKIHNNSKVVN